MTLQGSFYQVQNNINYAGLGQTKQHNAERKDRIAFVKCFLPKREKSGLWLTFKYCKCDFFEFSIVE